MENSVALTVKTWWPVVALITFGIAVRIWLLSSPLGSLDSDEAVVGLMARSIASGHHINAFFWGQPYGGSQEAIVAAALFAVFGSSVLLLKTVVVVASAGSAVLVYFIGKEIIEKSQARLGAALFWAGSFSAMWLSIKERGFYGTTMICGLVIVLAALKLVEKLDWKWAATGGFCVGVGLWASPQLAYFIVPVTLWLLVRNWRVLKTLWIILPAAMAGIIPAIVYNLHTSWSSLHATGLIQSSSYPERFKLFFTTGVPILLGMKVQYLDSWLGANWLGISLFLAVMIGAVIGLTFWGRHGLSTTRKSELLVVWIATYPFVFAMSPYSFYVVDPRYMIFLLPPLALVAASCLADDWRRVVPVMLAVCVFVVSGAYQVVHWQARWYSHDLVAGSISELKHDLAQHGVKYLYSDYWVAYRLDFESHGAYVASPLSGVRNADIQRLVNESARPAYIFFNVSKKAQSFEAQLSRKRVSFSEETAGQFTVVRPATHVDPGSIDGVW